MNNASLEFESKKGSLLSCCYLLQTELFCFDCQHVWVFYKSYSAIVSLHIKIDLPFQICDFFKKVNFSLVI